MKRLIPLLTLFFAISVFADTPPPGTVKAKMYSGDGVTAITSTVPGSMDVHVTNSGGLSTVNQGDAGVEAWLAAITSSVLPTNACQETGGHLASIDSKLTSPLAVTGTFWQATQPVSGPLTNTQLRAVPVDVAGTFWQATQPVSGTLTCNAGSGTQAVSLSSLPALATGANTIGNVNINGTVPISGTITATNSANADTGDGVPQQATQVGGVDGSGNLRAIKTSTAGVVSVDASGSTVPVSGTFWQATQPVSGTFWQATQPVSGPLTDTQLRATPLPVSGTFWQATQPVSGTVTANLGTIAGVATETTLDAIDTKLAGTLTVDGSGFTQPVSGTFWQATQPVSVASLPLPSGAASETTLAAINGKTPALGQALAGASVPVVLTASQLSTLTPLSTVSVNYGSGTFPVSGTFWQATQPVSGTFWQATQPVSGPLTDTQIRATPLPVSGTVAVTGTFWQATQPVSGTVTANAGSGTFAVSGAVTSTPTTPTALTIHQAAITVGTSAVRLTYNGSAPSSTRVLLAAQLLSSSTANCYLGSSGVTSSSTTRGIQMFAGQIFTFNNDAGDYYAICDSAAQTFLVTEQ